MSRTAIITFARMQPITIGHEKLVNTVKRVASKMNATPLVYLSHSNDSKRNPLSYSVKYGLARTAFGACVKHSSAKDIFSVLKDLDNDYDDVVFIGDKARADELQPIFTKYNGIDYNFNTITTMSAGDRESTDSKKLVDVISATKMRKYIAQNDYNSFTQGLPTKLRPYARLVQQLLRKGLNYAD